MAESKELLDPYGLREDGIKFTGRELGRGSYATVLELEYLGLKCAGKKIHDLLLTQGDASYTVCRFEEECRLLSQVRHPNIVQFLGVYFQQGVQVPILVMEFLPTNLTSCIEQYGILPEEISYSILHDVALGLYYLHSQTPPIIHRDLSSNNVLLTSDMTAKVSDLGVARMLSLDQKSRMTQTPGTPTYMPPEVMVPNPVYDTSVDEFSYGILMIHVFSGSWPQPQVGPTRMENGTLVPVTEAERHEKSLRKCGDDHPLMPLIQKCIDNNPQQRARLGEIVERLAEVVLQFPASFANRLEMLRHIEKATTTVAEFTTTITKLRNKINHIEEYLATKQQQPLQPSSITWETCEKLPICMNSGHATVINGKVYYGGGLTSSLSEGDGIADNHVYCYDPVQDKWTLLPLLSVKYFGLGQVKNELVATGGVQKYGKGDIQKAVYTYHEQTRQWQEQKIPPMPTARCLHGILSLKSALVVAGGQVSSSDDNGSSTNAVEVFKPDEHQWYQAKPLPVCLINMPMVLLHDTCYVIGGYRDRPQCHVYYTRVEALLSNIVAEDQTTEDLSDVWKKIPTDMPVCHPAAVTLAGNLLTIAGTAKENRELLTVQNGVYMYSSSSGTWNHIGDLLTPQRLCIAIGISPLEILVIGGCTSEGGDKNTVLKGRLQFLWHHKLHSDI